MASNLVRSRWAAVGAAVAVTLGAGGLSLSQAAEPTDGGPVYIALDTPCRVADTRSDPTLNIGTKNTPIAAGATNAYQIQITGNSGNCTGIPAEATAVAINLTAINNTNQSHFRVYPADSTLPGTANLVFGPGQTPLSNKVDVGLSADGAIKIYNHAGTTDAAVDIFGYYIDHTHDDRYYTRARLDAAREVSRTLLGSGATVLDGDGLREDSNCAYIGTPPGAGDAGTMILPIDVPAGSTITRVSALMVEGLLEVPYTVSFRRASPSVSGVSVATLRSTSGGLSSGPVEVDLSPAAPLLVEPGDAFQVRVSLEAPGVSLYRNRFCSATIEYTLPAP